MSADSEPSRKGGRMAAVANLLILAAIVYLLARPEGLVGSKYRAWQDARAVRATIDSLLPALQGAGFPYHEQLTPPARIFVFSDYTCPYCKRLDETIAELSRDGHLLPVSYLSFPRQASPEAFPGAVAALCAGLQGRFRAMHDHLFGDESWKTTPDWEASAIIAEVPDVPGFMACMESEESRRRVDAEVALGERLGVAGTPAIVTAEGLTIGTLDAGSLLRLAPP